MMLCLLLCHLRHRRQSANRANTITQCPPIRLLPAITSMCCPPIHFLLPSYPSTFCCLAAHSRSTQVLQQISQPDPHEDAADSASPYAGRTPDATPRVGALPWLLPLSNRAAALVEEEPV